MTAQHAQRQGKLVAQNVAASLGKGTPQPYKHRDLGFLVDLGGLAAAANPLNIPLSGLAANAHPGLPPVRHVGEPDAGADRLDRQRGHAHGSDIPRRDQRQIRPARRGQPPRLTPPDRPEHDGPAERRRPATRTRRRAAGTQRPDALYADRGYDHDKYRKQVREAGIKPVIARRGEQHDSGLPPAAGHPGCGSPGWRLRTLSHADAVAAYIGGLGCRRCRTVTRCGCSAPAVLAGRCPHGTAATALATGEPRPAPEGAARRSVRLPQIGSP